METNKEGRLRQTQSDIDSGYRSMTTLPLGLTQSSVSTRPSFYINDPELPLLSQPLTYLSSSESCISDSRPQSRLRHAEQGMNVFPVKEPHSLQRLRPSPTRSQQQMCREIEEKQLRLATYICSFFLTLHFDYYPVLCYIPVQRDIICL